MIEELLITTRTNKRGRPRTNYREVTKSSQEGVKAHEIRATFIVNEELWEQIKSIAYWERVTIKDIAGSALQQFITKYKEKKGSINKIPKQVKGGE